MTNDLTTGARHSHQFGEEGSTQFVRAMLETSLDIHRGELLCLIGPSGCGKSTLLNVIGGLLTPTSGQVLVGDTEVRGPLPHEIAYVFQENALFPWSTVLENVNLGMMFQGVPKAAREPRARKSLAAVGLSDFANHYPGNSPAACDGALSPARSASDRHHPDGRAVRRARRADPRCSGRISPCCSRAPARPSCS